MSYGLWLTTSVHLGARKTLITASRIRQNPFGPFCAISAKLRDEEWEQDGRFFNGYNEDSFHKLIGGHPSLRMNSIWISNDARPERKSEMWLNALLQRDTR